MMVRDKGNCFYISKVKDGILITTKEVDCCKKERPKIGIRLPECLLHRLDAHLANKTAIMSRTACILQAIEEALNKEAR